MAIKFEPVNSLRITGTQPVELKTMGWNYQITYIQHRNTK